MKKLILFMTILLGVNIGSYSAVNSSEEIDEVNKKIIKELSLFYGGYEKIYSLGIDKQNINFLLGEVEPKGAKKIEYDFQSIPNGKEINLALDEKIELKNISEIKKLKVVGKTYKNSLVDLKKEGGNLSITFSSIGEYKISFTEKNQETKEIIFKKVSKYQPYPEDIENNIEDSYNDGDFKFLNKNLLLLETFFPDSEEIEKGLFYALELNEKNKNYHMVRNISKVLVSKYRLDDEKKAEIIKIYLNALKELGETEEYLKFLEKLSTYDKKYELEYLDASINYKNYSSGAVKLAETKILTEPAPKVLDYLGDYHYQLKDYNKAITYYKTSKNLEKLALIYLETDDKNSYEILKSEVTSEQLDKIKEIEIKYLDRKKLEKYIGTAEKYTQEGRLQEAELYYKRSLKKDISPELKNNIYYKLADLYYNLNELELAEKNLKLIDIKVLDDEFFGDYYYLGGMIYYNLENYDESSKYFKTLIKKFPNTTLSNRGRIYILKIEKLNKNKLEKEVENESNS
ncbi:tetratricopeptide repeat protein [Fusobacteria bacterium ZRK30]|nr:tetratricopeptide repeat protein [Fusobacteria bacterium ZRK30]